MNYNVIHTSDPSILKDWIIKYDGFKSVVGISITQVVDGDIGVVNILVGEDFIIFDDER